MIAEKFGDVSQLLKAMEDCLPMGDQVTPVTLLKLLYCLVFPYEEY